jgi:hypothetical protein
MKVILKAFGIFEEEYDVPVRNDVVEQLIVIRDVEMGERKDLMKTRAGYNINLLIESLKKEEEK